VVGVAVAERRRPRMHVVEQRLFLFIAAHMVIISCFHSLRASRLVLDATYGVVGTEFALLYFSWTATQLLKEVTKCVALHSPMLAVDWADREQGK
jgi:hypothetical protein